MELNTPPGDRESYFDFVVAERPVYVPGSGPPLQPVTFQPIHDKTGIIESMVRINKEPKYVVTYQEHPGLRVSVRPVNILNWVSPRTLEEYEYEQTRKAKGLEEELTHPKDSDIVSHDMRETAKGKPGRRKRKKSYSLDGGPAKKKNKVSRTGPETSTGQKGDRSAVPAAFLSPQKAFTKSPKQPGLADTLPSASETDEFDNDENEDHLIHRQLLGHDNLMGTLSRSRLGVEISRSPTTSPDPLQSLERASKEDTADTQNETTTSHSPDDLLGPSNQAFPQDESVASLSSREAFAAYEELERRKQRQIPPADILPSVSPPQNKNLIVTNDNEDDEKEENLSSITKKNVGARCQRCIKNKKGCDLKRPCGRCRSLNIPAAACIPSTSLLGRIKESHSAEPDSMISKIGGAFNGKDNTAGISMGRGIGMGPEQDSETESGGSEREIRRKSSSSIFSRYSTLGREKASEAKESTRKPKPTVINLDSASEASTNIGGGRRRGVKAKPPPPPLPPVELEEQEWDEGEAEWEVEKLLADEVREDLQGNMVVFYQVRWMGDFEDSWEPEYNVGEAVKETYHKEKRARKRKVVENRPVKSENRSEKQWKGKQREMRGERPGSEGGNVNSNENGMGNGGKPPRGVEVISILSTDEEDVL